MVVGTLLFSRLLLYLTWDQLSLVEAKEQVMHLNLKDAKLLFAQLFWPTK